VTSGDIQRPASRTTLCCRIADEELDLLDDTLLNLLAENWPDLP
jgi:hypothetical protein